MELVRILHHFFLFISCLCISFLPIFRCFLLFSYSNSNPPTSALCVTMRLRTTRWYKRYTQRRGSEKTNDHHLTGAATFSEGARIDRRGGLRFPHIDQFIFVPCKLARDANKGIPITKKFPLPRNQLPYKEARHISS